MSPGRAPSPGHTPSGGEAGGAPGAIPPALARRVLARCLPLDDRGWLLAELDDLYAARVRERGEAAARRWYRRQVPGFWLRLQADRIRRAARALTDPRFLREMTHMDAYLADFRYALRRLLRTPLFTAVAVLSLALGIGANTAIFSLVNAVLLKGQPFSDPEELVEIYTSESDGYPYSTTSYPDYEAMRGETALFDGVVGTRTFPDFYASSPHKWLLAPQGTGLLWMAPPWRERLWPTLASGDWEKGGAQRFNHVGTLDESRLAGLLAALEFYRSVGPERIWDRVQVLQRRLREGLAAIPGVRLRSPEPGRSAGMTAFRMEGVDALALQGHLARAAQVRTRVIGEYELNWMRLSTHYYNLPGEVDRVLELLDGAARHGIAAPGGR